jgi:hypothetical protein
MKYIHILSASLLLIQCAKEKITLYHAFCKNTTSHKIEIRPYFSGSVPSNKIVVLNSNETREIANGFNRGIVGNAGFDSNYLSGSDSIVVVFDNLYAITHYFIQPAMLSSRHYLLSSNRNIYNKDNYTYTFADISKNKRESNYVYEFKEQDYLDAK